ncbi:MAG: glycerol kinase GlpK [Firmicutes bacterium]|nr:glycerol kinase GlpK [Bacillota bacterium]
MDIATRHILALDQGTTSSRAILFDDSGTIVAIKQQEFQQLYPQPGWVEHDPNEIWQTQITTAQEVLKDAGIRAAQVAAIGITNQRETTLLWDRQTGEPLANAIVWQDRRAASLCDRLRSEGRESLIQQKTGLVIDAYFSGTKLAWLLDHIAEARERAQQGELCFGTVDSWLLFNLTGGKVHATDVTNASRTMLYNIHEMQWDHELLELLHIPPEVLPQVRPSSGTFGETKTSLFGVAIPICGIAGDQQAALFGQTCFEPGMAKNTYGTGSFVLMNTGNAPIISKNKLLTTIAWQMGDQVTYALEGSIFVTGAAVQWLRDALGLIHSAEETEQLASTIDSNEGVYLVPAFTGLGAPYWDAYARGLLIGLTRGTTRAHIARATLESVAYQTYDVLEAMKRDSEVPVKQLRVDGGASGNAFLMQFQADVLQVPIVKPAVQETTAMGAAFLAGLEVGVWPSVDALSALWKQECTFSPHIDGRIRDDLINGWHRAVGRAQGWVQPEVDGHLR